MVPSTWNFSSLMRVPAWPHPRNNFFNLWPQLPLLARRNSTENYLFLHCTLPESAAGVLPNNLHPVKIKVIFSLLCIKNVFVLYHFIFVSSFPATSPACIHKNVWWLSVSWIALKGHWRLLLFIRISRDHLFTNTLEKFFENVTRKKCGFHGCTNAAIELLTFFLAETESIWLSVLAMWH